MTVRIRQGGYGTQYAIKVVISYRLPGSAYPTSTTIASLDGPDPIVSMKAWLNSIDDAGRKLEKARRHVNHPTLEKALKDLARLRSGEELEVVERKRKVGKIVEEIRYTWGWRCLRSTCFEGCPVRDRMRRTSQQCPKRYNPTYDDGEARILVVDDQWDEGQEYARLSILKENPVWSQRVHNFEYVLFSLGFGLQLDDSEAREAAKEALDLREEFDKFQSEDLLKGSNFLRLCCTRIKQHAGDSIHLGYMTKPLTRRDSTATAFWKLVAKQTPEQRICYVMHHLGYIRAEANRKLDRIWNLINSLGPIRVLAQGIINTWLKRPASPLEIRVTMPEIAIALSVHKGKGVTVDEVKGLIHDAEEQLQAEWQEWKRWKETNGRSS